MSMTAGFRVSMAIVFIFCLMALSVRLISTDAMMCVSVLCALAIMVLSLTVTGHGRVYPWQVIFTMVISVSFFVELRAPS